MEDWDAEQPQLAADILPTSTVPGTVLKTSFGTFICNSDNLWEETPLATLHPSELGPGPDAVEQWLAKICVLSMPINAQTQADMVPPADLFGPEQDQDFGMLSAMTSEWDTYGFTRVREDPLFMPSQPDFIGMIDSVLLGDGALPESGFSAVGMDANLGIPMDDAILINHPGEYLELQQQQQQAEFGDLSSEDPEMTWQRQRPLLFYLSQEPEHWVQQEQQQEQQHQQPAVPATPNSHFLDAALDDTPFVDETPSGSDHDDVALDLRADEYLGRTHLGTY